MILHFYADKIFPLVVTTDGNSVVLRKLYIVVVIGDSCTPKVEKTTFVYTTCHSSVFTPSFSEKFMPTFTMGFGCILNESA